jgi:hypothetical protein
LPLDFGFTRTRSGSFLPPVSRFHSSKVSFEIFPSTRSCANAPLRLALEGMHASVSNCYPDVAPLVERSLVCTSDNADVTISLKHRKRHVSQFSDVPVQS